jgi:hypothetical protein
MVFDPQTRCGRQYLGGEQEMSTKQDFLLGSGPVQKFHGRDGVENILILQDGDVSPGDRKPRTAASTA